MSVELRFRTSQEALVEAAASEWMERLRVRDPARTYGVALSGGRLAAVFFDAVVAASAGRASLYQNIHFFWADERCVPPSDSESNYRVALEHLFRPLSISSENIHRIYGEVDQQYAVKQAEAEICRLLPMTRDAQPVLDLVFLGMGEDGHIASLFPNEPAAMMWDSAVFRAVRASKPPPQRITIGYQPLLAAREVWVLASGAGKKEAFLAGLRGEKDLPISRLVKNRAKTLYFNDIAEII